VRALDPATEIEARLAGETSEAPAVVLAEPSPFQRGMAGPARVDDRPALAGPTATRLP
jgi:hypothetical protein